MRNLLHAPLPETELQTLFATCPPVPLLPVRGDTAWLSAARKPATQALLAALLPRAQAETNEPLPVLTDALYRDFHTSGGSRKAFEAVYFERRRRLARFVFCALFAPDADQWIPAVLRAWDDVFAEPSWALTAHVSDPSGRDPYTLDLFAGETANLMAELLTVFADDAGEARTTAIRARLRDQFFDNYLAQPPSGGDKRGWQWLTTTNNWNAVCHQGVLGAALALEADADLLARLFFAASPRLKHFLSGFTPDGGCSEGPGYWGYGFGWLAVLNEQLETRTRGALSLFDGDAHVAEIARFGRRTLLTPDTVACFGDGSAKSLPRASLLSYLGTRLHDDANGAEAARRYAALTETPPNPNGERMDTFFLLRTVHYAPDTAAAPPPPAPFENVFLPSLVWWISHGTDTDGNRWAVAAKGGTNDEHHNHNDLGSFILVLNGQTLVEEIGASEYTRDFFSAKRYGFLATRSLGHSVPLINQCEQKAGAEFTATVLRAEFGPTHDEFSIDLTGAYPLEARCRRAVRTFRVTREPFSLEITDEFAMDAPDVTVETALITHHEWEAIGDGFLIRAKNQTLRVTPDTETRFLRGETPTYPGKPHGKSVEVARLVFAPTASQAGTASARIGLTLRPE